jgi:hypothetical protein
MTSVPCLWVTSSEVNRLSPDVGITWLSTWPQFDTPKAGVIDCILPVKNLIGSIIHSSNCPEPFEIELTCGSQAGARSDVASQLAVTGAPGPCLRCDTMDVRRLLTDVHQDPDAPVDINIPAAGVYLAKSAKNKSLHYVDAAGCSDLSIGQA